MVGWFIQIYEGILGGLRRAGERETEGPRTQEEEGWDGALEGGWEVP